MAGSQGQGEAAEQAAPATISDEDFRRLLSKRARGLLRLVAWVSQVDPASASLTRPVLGDLLSQATQLEELLDAYGAATNQTWHKFRSFMAAIKQFSDFDYELLHIRQARPSYMLLAIEEDFADATERAIAFAGEVLKRTAGGMVAESETLTLAIPAPEVPPGAYEEQLPPGLLPRDRERRATADAGEVVTNLATSFLSLAAESKAVHVASRARAEEYPECFPDPVSEEKLRYLQHRFHNLQSLYDTYVSDTKPESLDADLPVLRGHISVVFHLLKTATLLAHYYERHVNLKSAALVNSSADVVTARELLDVLMSYSIAFASRFLSCGIQLCQGMLDRYAEVGRIEVPLPEYRGFHVRPATLVSKIVTHYGSNVRMELEGESYDAGSSLEMFRVNEKINAGKRGWLSGEIERLGLVPSRTDREFATVVRGVVMVLAELGKVVIYEHPLAVQDRPAADEASLLEQVIDEIARLQATAKIDIRADLTVAFVGDKRVLADIKLLAESGYGEDNFGNNIPLPEELAYLRR